MSICYSSYREEIMRDDILFREENFHNKWANSVDPKSVKVDELQTACTMPETRYIIESLGDLKNQEILEIGCGCGEASVYFAKHGANVTATDISEGMVELAKNVASYHGVSIMGKACPADALPFKDHSFDIVYAANVLHHVDIGATLREVKRVLKKDGIFVCWDPIKYNPAINIYRRLASNVRTIDEHPVDKAYLKTIRKTFKHVTSKGFWLLTNLVFVRYFFWEKLDPGKVRYWKQIIDDAERLKSFYMPLERADRFLLHIFPFLKWMCWNMVIIADNAEA